jgi:hypothetical protein
VTAYSTGYASTIGNVVYRFDDMKTLLAKASPGLSGYDLARISAASAEVRVAAQIALSDLPLDPWRELHAGLVCLRRGKKLLYPADLSPNLDPSIQDLGNGTAEAIWSAINPLLDPRSGPVDS